MSERSLVRVLELTTYLVKPLAPVTSTPCTSIVSRYCVRSKWCWITHRSLEGSFNGARLVVKINVSVDLEV